MHLVRLMSDHRARRLGNPENEAPAYRFYLAPPPDFCPDRYTDPEFVAYQLHRPYIGLA